MTGRKTLISQCTRILLSWFLFIQLAYGQSPQTEPWSWVPGPNIINQPAIYKHATDPKMNTPGSRRYAVSWVDNSGNLWLFGGLGYTLNGEGSLNDLWQYDMVNSQWSWIGGNTSVNNPGVYARKDFDPKNQPGARAGALSWTDTNGNLWLFGGFGNASGGDGLLNDLWQYNITRNQWRWVGGDSTIDRPGVFAKRGADPGNKPAARAGALSWIDKTGNLWLFGGFRRNASRDVHLNDLWQFNIATNQWSWISGDSTLNNPGVYVKQPDVKGQPAARRDALSWIDAGGNLWLFGGFGNTLNGDGRLNDLWQFDIAKSQWSWIAGDSTRNKPGVYVTKAPHPGNKPGARWDAVTWTDKTGNLWLFGGDGYDSRTEGQLNDLWQFDFVKKQWSWIGGDSTINNTGIYVKAPDRNSQPGARAGAVSWTDKTGNFWLFGGMGYASNGPGYLNDLWKFIPCTIPGGTINLASRTLCFGDSINLVVTSTGGTSFQWYRNNDPISGATTARYTARTAGTYKVRIYTEGGCTALASDSSVIRVNPAINATASGIVHASCTASSGSATITATGGTAPYTYSIDGGSFAAMNKFDNLAAGNHKVTVRDNAGCSFDLNVGINQSTSTLTATASGIIHSTCTSNTGSATITASGGTAPYTYSIDGGGFAAVNKFDNLAPGNHKVTVRDNAGCSFDLNFSINQSTSTLTATTSGITQATCTSNNGSATITAAGGTAPYNYSIDGGGFAAVNKFDNLAPGNHKVTVRDNAGCSFDVNFSINRSTSTLTATAVDISHSSCTASTGSATITATGGTAPYTYSIDGGSFAAANKFDKLAPGKHNVIVKDNGGCTFNLTIPSINATNPGITYSAVIVTAAAPYPLSARSNVGTTYSWSPGAGLDDPKRPNPTVTTNTDVTYLVTITAVSGCITVDTQRVMVAKPAAGNVKDSVVAVPTAFTPNRNGMNDRLKPIPYSIKTLTYFKIYNRWGQLVFETNTVGVGWDGTLKGLPQPAETYTWILECISASGTRIRQSGKSVLIR